MTTYTITNTSGDTVASLAVTQTTGNSFPIILLGQGVSTYGGIMAENLYRMMENFASDNQPTNPVEGMNWYSKDTNVPYYYDGSAFQPYAVGGNSEVGFEMLSAANGIDMTTTGTTTVFQADGSTLRFMPTGILLVPSGTVSVTSPAAFNLFVDSSEDVMETVTINNTSTDKFSNFRIEGTTKFLTGSETLKMEVTTAASGGDFEVDVRVVGYRIS